MPTMTFFSASTGGASVLASRLFNGVVQTSLSGSGRRVTSRGHRAQAYSRFSHARMPCSRWSASASFDCRGVHMCFGRRLSSAAAASRHRERSQIPRRDGKGEGRGRPMTSGIGNILGDPHPGFHGFSTRRKRWPAPLPGNATSRRLIWFVSSAAFKIVNALHALAGFATSSAHSTA
jgi:hypothetical protein